MAFGTLIFRSGTTANAYLYCSEPWDADLGLYYLRARYLNPDSGRFWSGDPFGGSRADPQSLHRYGYAHGNPVMGYDPSGNFTLMEVAVTVAVVGTLVAIAKPAIRPMVATVVGFLGGNPDARYSLSYLGVYDESEQLMEALDLSPEDFSKNLLADAFTELGTDVVATAAGGHFASGLAAFRRSTPVKFPAAESKVWSRAPQSLQDQMSLGAAQRGAGTKIIDSLGDPKFKGMEKWEYKVKSTEGRDSVIHYVRDPKTGELMDFKFKKHSNDMPTLYERTPEPSVSSGNR